MKPPVALFKKKIMKLYLFLKTKSQVKAYQHSQLVVCCLLKGTLMQIWKYPYMLVFIWK